MKKYALLVIVTLLVCTAAAAYETPDQKSVRVKNTRYDPFPIEPGSYFDVWVRVENFGSSDIENFKFRLKPEYPFSIDPNEDPLRDYGLFVAGEQALFNFKVRTDINAVEGNNPLHYEYTVASNQWNNGQFNIEIYTLDPTLSIERVDLSKQRIAPGEHVDADIILKNLGDSSLKDIKVKLNLIEFVQTSTGFDARELPISPVGSSDERAIKTIEGGEESTAEFSLIVDPSAESKVYKIPVTITYNDLQGNNYTKNNIISIIVGSEPDLSVTIDESTAHFPGITGDIIVKFVNRGFSEIKFLYATIEKNGEFEILSPHEVYMGNVDSDDYETAEYSIYIDEDAEKEVTIPLIVNYKDTNNQNYNKRIELKTKVYTSGESKKYGFSSGNSYIGIIIVVAIVGFGYIVYRRFRKSKNSKKKVK